VGRLEEWSIVASLPTGRVHVSVMPIGNKGQELGFAVLLTDLSSIELRVAKARTPLIIAFGILAVMALVVPMFVAKLARYDWSLEVRRLLHSGGEKGREFQPILMANEREDAPEEWTAERLKQNLNRHLHGERIVILANPEPYIHQHTSDGGTEVQHPASGLVTALEPVMRACSGVWVAHGSGGADRETVDPNDHLAERLSLGSAV